MKENIGIAILRLLLFFCLSFMLVGGQGSLRASEDWKESFADVCGKTHNVMAFSIEKLESSIKRCEELQEDIDSLDGAHGTEKKVYAKRLKMCRDLYVFALEQKKAQETENGEK